MEIVVLSGEQLKKELDEAYRDAQRASRGVRVAIDRLSGSQRRGLDAAKILRAEMLLTKWLIEQGDAGSRLTALRERAMNWFTGDVLPDVRLVDVALVPDEAERP